VVEVGGVRRDANIIVLLEEEVCIVLLVAAGCIEVLLLPGGPKQNTGYDLREKLNAWTGRRWMVALSNTRSQPPLGQVKRERKAAEIAALKEHPSVAAVLKAFPDAEITDVRRLSGTKTDDTGTG
jgi:DNA polymerase-3 subunit gamma/tau